MWAFFFRLHLCHPSPVCRCILVSPSFSPPCFLRSRMMHSLPSFLPFFSLCLFSSSSSYGGSSNLSLSVNLLIREDRSNAAIHPPTTPPTTPHVMRLSSTLRLLKRQAPAVAWGGGVSASGPTAQTCVRACCCPPSSKCCVLLHRLAGSDHFKGLFEG